MKLGPVSITLKEKPPIKVEIGATGTVFFAGYLAEEEYNTDLQGEKAIKVYERMRRSDGQVKAALLSCELPLRAAHWDIEAASDDPLDQEIAEFVHNCLFEWMTITWDDFLRHILLMLPFGFSVFEKVWELSDGKYRWRKLAPRLPKTIFRWLMDPEGGLKEIEQRAWNGDTYQTVTIPAEKLLVFSLGKEGSNFTGTSLLRSAYKHWYFKDQLYRIDGIAAERHGVGVAVFNLPSTATTGSTDSDYARIEKIGESLHTHERSYVALPEGYQFDLKGVTGQLHDIIRSIEHHDMQIVRSILAQFINLGSSEVGSYALSQDQSGFFLMSLRAVGKGICDTIDRYAIRQLVDYNWDVKHYPRLVISGLESRNMAVYTRSLLDVVSAGLVVPDQGIESELRRFMHLPAKKVEEELGTKPSAKMKFSEFQPARHPRGVEVNVAFDEIYDTLNNTEQKFVAAVKDIQHRQIALLVDTVSSAIEKGKLDSVVDIEPPLKLELAAAVEKVLTELFNYGREQVSNELRKQGGGMKAAEPKTPPPANFLKARAKATANVLSAKLKAAISWESLRQVRDGQVDRGQLRAALTLLSDQELVATAKFSVSEAFNLGREVEATASKSQVDRVVYSALMDDNTCGPCRELDGQEFAYPSPQWDEVTPPLKNCEGRDRCRCVGVYVFKTEAA